MECVAVGPTVGQAQVTLLAQVQVSTVTHLDFKVALLYG